MRQPGWGFNRTKRFGSSSSHSQYSENKIECVLFSRILFFLSDALFPPKNRHASMLLIMTFLSTRGKDGFVEAAHIPVNFTTVYFHSCLPIQLS